MAITKASKSGFTRDTQQKYDDFLAGNKGYNPYFLAGYLGTTANAYTGSFSVDSSNNIYLSGSLVASSYNRGFLAKLTSTFNSTFQRQLDRSSASIQFTGAAVDSTSSNVYCSATQFPSLGIIKYDTSGNIIWQYSYRDPNTTNDNSTATAVARDSSDNVYVCGYGDGYNWNRGMLVKVNSSGTFAWGIEIGSAGSFAEAVAVDSSNNVYVAGLADSVSQGSFLQKLNINGTSQWKKKITVPSNYIYWYGMNINNSNSTIALAGNDSSTNYMVMAQYDLSGNLNWQRSINISGVSAKAIGHDSSNNIYFGMGRYLLKFNSSGTLQWQREMLPEGGSFEFSDIKIINNLIYFSAIARRGQNQFVCMGQLPTDGGTGVNPYYINGNFSFTYQATSRTVTTTTYTAGDSGSSVTGPSYTRTTTSYTGSTPTYTFITST